MEQGQQLSQAQPQADEPQADEARVVSRVALPEDQPPQTGRVAPDDRILGGRCRRVALSGVESLLRTVLALPLCEG